MGFQKIRGPKIDTKTEGLLSYRQPRHGPPNLWRQPYVVYDSSIAHDCRMGTRLARQASPLHFCTEDSGSPEANIQVPSINTTWVAVRELKLPCLFLCIYVYIQDLVTFIKFLNQQPSNSGHDFRGSGPAKVTHSGGLRLSLKLCLGSAIHASCNNTFFIYRYMYLHV